MLKWRTERSGRWASVRTVVGPYFVHIMKHDDRKAVYSISGYRETCNGSAATIEAAKRQVRKWLKARGLT